MYWSYLAIAGIFGIYILYTGLKTIIVPTQQRVNGTAEGGKQSGKVISHNNKPQPQK